MKTYLPHSFKKIGIGFVLIAVVFSVIGGIDREIQEYAEIELASAKQFGRDVEKAEEQLKRVIEEEPIIPKKKAELYIMISLFFSISGFLIYLFSNEEIDDEYIQQIRLKSIYQSLLVSWLIYAVMKLMFSQIPFDGIYILQFQLILYVCIFRHNKYEEILGEDEEIALGN